MKKMIQIQDIQTSPLSEAGGEESLYFRSNKAIFTEPNQCTLLYDDTFVDYFTYFNALSIGKWLKFSYATCFYLVLDIQGCFGIKLFGHYVEHKIILKEVFGAMQYNCKERTKLVIPIPSNCKSTLVGFHLQAHGDVRIFDSYYAADSEQESRQDIQISMVTTTYRKEKYIENNIQLLNNELFSNCEFAKHFYWYIIDNGRTLTEMKDESIQIISNDNTGGSGGFARGMIEALESELSPTHILLMDDDVRLSVESLKRLYRLLCIIRPEYAEHFISGAMINMEWPVIQHENTGKLDKNGRCIPLGSGMNLGLWDTIIWNEYLRTEEEGRHAAWWFCCVPTTVARLDNLPLPLFVRGDDIEYSIRNHARLLTMNGICVWHQAFAVKYDPVMEHYQSRRNELIISALRPELSEVDTFGFIEEVFWQELYKFSYHTASLLCDAVEDYLKGPEWLISVDQAKLLREKRATMPKLYDLFTESTEEQIKDSEESEERFYREDKIKKLIYDYSFNGQARIPDILIKKKKGCIPLNGGYFPNKQMLATEIICVDRQNEKFTINEKRRDQFKALRNRFLKLRSRYYCEDLQIKKQYMKEEPNIKSYFLSRGNRAGRDQ